MNRTLTVGPDWICEVLSPNNAGYDEEEKLSIYHAAGVPWVWHVDPEGRLVRVHAYDPRGYLVKLTLRADAEAPMPPFDAVTMVVREWFVPKAVV